MSVRPGTSRWALASDETDLMLFWRETSVVWLAVMFVLAMVVAGVSVSEESRSSLVGPASKAAQAERCVEPREMIRRNHMDFMLHQRDLTVREGVRGGQYSLAACIDCHVQRDARGQAIPIDAEKQFCQACHAKAAVRIDCFSCHSRVP